MPDDRTWLAGLFVPVTTPFDPVTGDPAPVALRENLRGWLDQPIDGVVLFGSTGEGALLDADEKERLLGFARDVVGHRALVAGAAEESTRATVRSARRMAQGGADAVLVHPPWYFGRVLDSGALRDHYLAVADSSPAPVLVYHMPKYTGVTLEAGLVGELSRHPNIAGIKDSSGDLKRFAEYSHACASSCRLLVGNGALLFAALALGAAGGIVAAGLLAGSLYGDMLRLHATGRDPDAGRLQERLAPVHKEIVARFGVPGVKAALDLLGMQGGPPRPPLRALGEKDRQRVARVMQDAGLL